jgi:hypothetical protein
MWTYISQFIVFLLALIGVMWKSIETDQNGNSIRSKRGFLVLTRAGKIIVVCLFISFFLSVYTTYLGSKESKEKEEKLNADLAKVQTQNLSLSGNVDSLAKQNISEFEKQKNNFVSVLDTQRESTAATTQKIENSANTLLKDLRNTSTTLNKKLNSSIDEVETTINTLSLERDLFGVEISFRPSTKHWANILEAYKGIESPVKPAELFAYSASTMIAEGRNGYWKIDFTPVERKEGSIRFSPVSTDRPENRAFEKVINAAVINLLITWGDGIVTEISPRGNYPSSVTVSQDLITFTLRSPDLRLNLNYLKTHPTIILKGASYPPNLRNGGYPVDVRVRSLDHSAIFDQTITLNWAKGTDESHLGKMMPYVSGPHSLAINFKTLNQ